MKRTPLPLAKVEAAEAAALGFFLLGTFRCLLVKVRRRSEGRGDEREAQAARGMTGI
jgi:hypothetical protein